MNIPFRTVTIHASALLFVATCAAACSSAPDGTGETVAQSTEQALSLPPKCDKGYAAVSQGWDIGANGKPIESWACEVVANNTGVSAATYAGGPASGYSDTCGSVAVPTPASLPSTCTLGTVITSDTDAGTFTQYFFACPTGTAAPASLGLVSPEEGLCADTTVANETCEVVEVVSSLSSNCLGSPLPGWEYIVDALDLTANHQDGKGGQGGGCSGGCALVAEPPVSRTTAP